MPNLNMSDANKIRALAALLGKTACPTPLTLRLFSNNHTPADGDTVGSYTEVAGGGYAAFVLTAASWVIAVATGVATAAYAAHQFTFTGATTAPGTVYGYYITDTNGALVVAQLLDAPPFTPATNGDAVVVTPEITLADAA